MLLVGDDRPAHSPLQRTLFARSVVVLPGHALQVGLAASRPPAEVNPGEHGLHAGLEPPMAGTSSLPAGQAKAAAAAVLHVQYVKHITHRMS
jgi:hypothetical protein